MAKKQDEVIVYALGGLGEVGKNCYGIEYNDQLFIIDCGILFPDLQLGVDYIIPDFSYLVKNQKKIAGLFITHGHEDHIGGIPYLAKQLKINNIYASGIAIDLIKSKFLDYPGLELPEIIKYNEDSIFEFDKVKISFIRMNHSIPDSHAIVVETPLGKIIHTGDFKIDFTPHAKTAEFDKLSALGRSGVLLLLCDSTNAMQEGFSVSEGKVEESINDLFETINGRIIIATFASNMYRIDQIIEASIATKRKIAVVGKSMKKMIEIGLANGFIKAKESDFIDEENIQNYTSDRLTILSTGSQGEPLAALTRIANGTHRSIKINKKDTIIFSSSPIPGNAESVNRTINALFKSGARVIVNSPLNDIHASGHANQGELKMIHSMVKEKYFMPIHGEYRMQKMNAKMAAECGIPLSNSFILENGNILHLEKDKAYVKGSIPTGEVYIDGAQIGINQGTIMKERRQLSNDGLFDFIFTINVKTREIVGNVNVVSRGFILMKGNEDLTKELIRVAQEFVQDKLNQNIELKDIKEESQKYMAEYINKMMDRTPIVDVIFSEVGYEWKDF